MGPLPGLAQDWGCLQVESNGDLTLGWAPDALGAASYSIDYLLPPPDYLSFLQSDVDLAANPTGAVLTAAGGFDFSSQSFCFTLLAQDAAR